MPGFVAINPTDSQAVLRSTDFWPPIALAEVRAVAKLDGSVPDARLRHAVLLAIDSVNHELAPWALAQQASGYAQLSDVPGVPLAGPQRLVVLYFQAVVCLASADLLEQSRGYDSSSQGALKADGLTPRIDEQRRAAHWAMSAMLGRTRSTVELI